MNQLLLELQSALEGNDVTQIAISLLKVKQAAESGLTLSPEDFSGLKHDVLLMCVQGAIAVLGMALQSRV